MYRPTTTSPQPLPKTVIASEIEAELQQRELQRKRLGVSCKPQARHAQDPPSRKPQIHHTTSIQKKSSPKLESSITDASLTVFDKSKSLWESLDTPVLMASKSLESWTYQDLTEFRLGPSRDSSEIALVTLSLLGLQLASQTGKKFGREQALTAIKLTLFFAKRLGGGEKKMSQIAYPDPSCHERLLNASVDFILKCDGVTAQRALLIAGVKRQKHQENFLISNPALEAGAARTQLPTGRQRINLKL